MSESRLHPEISSTLRFDGRYDLVAHLGGGAFGEVWEAHDTTTGRTVALKLIDPAFATPDDAWREATYLTSLASPNSPNTTFLVAVHGAAMSELGVPYIDMALLNGSVESRVLPRGVDEATAIQWTQRVARGLHLCHERRLVHRDVKPGNILLSRTDDALLGDFGVAAVMAADGTAACHGDVNIWAPEVFGGRCAVQSDVYALGVSLYVLVTGDYPYRFNDYGDDVVGFGNAVKSGVPDVREIAPHLSLGLARVLREATEADPRKRYQTAAAFDEALAGVKPLRRVIQEVSPCQDSVRCWRADPGASQPLRPVHVCVAQYPGGGYEIKTRHVGGQRITAQCAKVTSTQLTGRLRSVFRSLH